MRANALIKVSRKAAQRGGRAAFALLRNRTNVRSRDGIMSIFIYLLVIVERSRDPLRNNNKNKLWACPARTAPSL